MSDEMISRSRARTVRLASQAAAAVLVVGACLLVTVGAPFLSTSDVEPISREHVHSRARELAAQLAASKPREEERAELPPDFEAIEYSLSMVKNAPQPKDEPEESEDPDPAGPESAEQEGRTRFLGTIAIGDRMLALLSAGGGQRILGPGQSAVLALAPGDQGEAAEVEVLRVTSDAVWLTENGVEYRVERAVRTGFAVSHGASLSSTVTASRPESEDEVMDAAIAIADKPLNPDAFRRDDGTIDYEALRKAARARAKARQELRKQRRDDGDEN